ncbi:hypothetical protein EIN_319710 [Entamoeba invadens IP1]|uniref:EGF-like domain-containing protein n=1 Tax=Entamoeba invadens IP1 TaxID=370355 RepID=A0A0A1TZM3_ENTIV|nr:hypothetical protein EIN_319710 [Entamoeba invadens IP1]ELP87032.1 hypothetical protein EIN_319710 [Entamoeba invadens IP1]|eukprot:XP_004253803.1 hypothetical protein EIN_319710 [Entamoeba invadens IP1]
MYVKYHLNDQQMVKSTHTTSECTDGNSTTFAIKNGDVQETFTPSSIFGVVLETCNSTNTKSVIQNYPTECTTGITGYYKFITKDNNVIRLTYTENTCTNLLETSLVLAVCGCKETEGNAFVISMTCAKTCGDNEEFVDNECRCKTGYQKVGDKCVPQCTAHATYNTTSAHCECDNGYVSVNEKCEKTCGENEVYNLTSDTCECKVGYIRDNEKCVSKCKENEVYNTQTDKCQCVDGYTLFNSICTKNCEANFEFNSEGKCVCKSGYELLNNDCVVTCLANQIRNTVGECICDASKNYVLVDGICVIKGDTSSAFVPLLVIMFIIGIIVLIIILLVVWYFKRRRNSTNATHADPFGASLVPDELNMVGVSKDA